MTGITGFLRTTIGKKVVMAVTGLIWVGYLVMHMYGNLKIFAGAEYFNTYAAGLRTLGAPVLGYGHMLWIARAVMILTIGLHIWASLSLANLNRMQARGNKYHKHTKLAANAAQSTMIYGGIGLALFILYHLMHLTFGVSAVHPTFDHANVYANVVSGFQGAGFYLYMVALFCIGMHLFHGCWSTFQTLGLNTENISGKLKALSVLVALAVSAGFAVVPVAVMAGYVK